MEHPHVAILSNGCCTSALPPDRFTTVTIHESLEGLPALNLDLVLIEFDDPAVAFAQAERIQHELPAVAVVLCGPPLDSGTMAKAMRAGIREVVTDPGPGELEEALDRSLARRQRLKEAQTGPFPRPQGKVIVVHSPKGGAGKSTLAANLAYRLRETGAGPVALLDLSLHGGDLDLMLGARTNATWADLAESELFGIDEIESALMPCANGLRLLAAPSLSEEGDRVDAKVVERALTLMRERYAFIVIDTAAVLSEPILKAMDLADQVLVPLPMTLPALRQVQRGLSLWAKLGIPASRLSLAAWSASDEISQAEAEKVLQARITFPIPHDPTGIEDAMNAGEALIRLQPRGAFAKAIARIADAFSDRPTPEHGGQGRFQWLWKQISQQVRRNDDVSTQKA